MPETTPPTTSRRTSGGRVVAIVAGSLAGLLALAMLAGGGALLWGDAQKDNDGYLSTGTDRYHTTTTAITSDNLDVDTDGASRLVRHDLFGTVRLRAESRDGKPVFVGIAKTADVDRYLAGSAHATVTDVDYDPFHATYRTVGGARQVAAPATQRIWAAQASGAGRHDVTWEVEDGDWSVVVMNADGSANVDAGVVAGAQLPWMDEAGWITIGAGLLFLVIGGGLLFVGARPARRAAEPAGLAPVAV